MARCVPVHVLALPERKALQLDILYYPLDTVQAAKQIFRLNARFLAARD